MLNQSAILHKLASSSDWSDTGSSKEHKRLVSYVYITTFEEIELGSELTLIMNNNGPKIEPCGMPTLTDLNSDKAELILTTLLLISSYDLNHDKVFPLMP